MGILWVSYGYPMGILWPNTLRIEASLRMNGVPHLCTAPCTADNWSGSQPVSEVMDYPRASSFFG